MAELRKALIVALSENARQGGPDLSYRLQGPADLSEEIVGTLRGIVDSWAVLGSFSAYDRPIEEHPANPKHAIHYVSEVEVTRTSEATVLAWSADLGSSGSATEDILLRAIDHCLYRSGAREIHLEVI